MSPLIEDCVTCLLRFFFSVDQASEDVKGTSLDCASNRVALFA